MDAKSWILKHRKIVLAIAIFLIIEAFVSGSMVMFSDSMSPSINKGDLIHYEKIPYEQIKVGDVIIFSEPPLLQNPIIHRVIKVNESGIITKGDNDIKSDEGMWGFITSDKIIGKVTFSIPLIGYAFVIPAYVVGLPLNSIIALLIFIIISYLLSFFIFWIYDKFKKK